MGKKIPTPRSDHDSAWKRALLKYLPNFFELFFPELGKQVDWSRRPKFRDKELQTIAPMLGKGGGQRTVDVLVELHWRDSGPMLVLVHIEIQSQKESGFPKRVFFYHARISEIYDRPLCTLVVLADKDRSWRPDSYCVAFAGSRLQFEFPTVKLLDFENRLPELLRSTNPFAHLVAATLINQASKFGSKERNERKYSLVTGLYNLGLSRKEIIEFYGFIDQIVRLPRSQEKKFRSRLQQFEKEKKMRYITSIEKLGREEGREEGLQEVAKRMMAEGFALEQILRITGATAEQLQQWLEPEKD